MKKIKNYLAKKLIGNFYTETECKEILLKMQYEMAQHIIGNRKGQEPILPTDFWEKNNKYKNGFFKLKNL